MRALLPLLLLAACSSQLDDPGAVTADENRRLDEAAAMLDANSVDLNALDGEPAAGNAE
jgi:hypothetical protein